MSDDMILNFATNSGHPINLSADNLLFLNSQGVSHKVIMALLHAEPIGAARTPSFVPGTITQPGPNSLLIAPTFSQDANNPFRRVEDVKTPEEQQPKGQSGIQDHHFSLFAAALIVCLLFGVPSVSWALKQMVVVYIHSVISNCAC